MGGQPRSTIELRLFAETRPVETLDAAVVERMWSLFDGHYADVSFDGFRRDLGAKDHVFLLRDRVSRALRGFSTVQSYVRSIAGRSVRVVFSGDTVCEERFRGQRALHSAFLRYVMRLKLSHPWTPTYWFLISKGFKTYLLLARNFPEFWPRPDRDTPTWQAKLLDSLARERFGDAWHPQRGVLHFASPMGRLRPEVAPIGRAELADVHIRFFSERNPRAAIGDELCCLGKIDLRLALRYAERRFGRWAAGRVSMQARWLPLRQARAGDGKGGIR